MWEIKKHAFKNILNKLAFKWILMHGGRKQSGDPPKKLFWPKIDYFKLKKIVILIRN